jgi:hypothetical protein
MRKIEALGNLLGDAFQIKKLAFNVLHRFASRADKVVVRVQISIDTKCRGVRRDLTQQAALNEKTEIVVNGRQRDRRDPLANGFIDLLGRMMSVSSDNSFVHYLPLVSGGEATLPCEIAELLMGESH